jgi:thioredoxin reductase
MSIALRTTWTNDVVLLTDGPSRLSRGQREELARFGITVKAERIARLEGAGGMLERVVFKKGQPLERRAIFLNTGFEQQCDLAHGLGCIFTPKGVLQADKHERTNIPGVYVAGDASRDTQMVIVAAAEGVKAAQAINEDLQRETRALINQAASHAQ